MWRMLTEEMSREDKRGLMAAAVIMTMGYGLMVLLLSLAN